MNTTNNDYFARKVVAVVLSLGILGVAYYGSYMPLRKAQMFIATLQGLQSTPPTSLNDLENRLSIPLNYGGPIGQEELVRNTANSVLNFVQQSHDATSTAEMLRFLMSYYNPILAQGKGMSFGQDLYLVGAINELAFANTGNTSYLSAAHQYYEEGNQLGPNRPQPLYGLFDVYHAAGDVSDTIAIGNKILANWPSDQNVAAAIAQLEGTSKTPTSTLRVR